MHLCFPSIIGYRYLGRLKTQYINSRDMHMLKISTNQSYLNFTFHETCNYSSKGKGKGIIVQHQNNFTILSNWFLDL